MLRFQWPPFLAGTLACTAWGSAAQMNSPTYPPALPPGAVWVVPQGQVYVQPVYPFQGQIAVPSEGYPSNRNLNLDNRAPAVGPINPPPQQAKPHAQGQFGHVQPGWGSMPNQRQPNGEESWKNRRN